MKVSIETLNNGHFEKAGIWKKLFVPNQKQKQEAIKLTKIKKAVINPKGVVFILSSLNNEDVLIALKDDVVQKRFDDAAIEKFKKQMNHPSFKELAITLY